jgi:hypothetical protein
MDISHSQERITPGIAWLSEAWRVLSFRAPRWERLSGGPWTLAALVLLALAIGLGLQRAAIDGPATFEWHSIFKSWSATVVSVWICWLLLASGKRREPGPANVGTLISLLVAVTVLLNLIDGVLAQLAPAVFGSADDWPAWARWTAWLFPMVWEGLASLRLWWRITASGVVRVIAIVLTPLPIAISGWLDPMYFWWPAGSAEAREEFAGLTLSEEVLDTQASLITDALRALPPSQPGLVNVYAATYAPYASQDVFMHESAVVAKTMAERFGTAGRTVQLVTNAKSQNAIPWATRPNLHKTIARIGAVMDREKDVLFLHLTSHGGRDGLLATDSYPLESEPMTPALLKQWLDEAGIRWRVISVSACFSGSWIEPLADEGTLVMTAADATHTSYGCGSRSPLTFFGQAMYVDALKETWSFQQAHAQARQLIEVREKEAGKTDGYSNPQIREGAAIGEVLKRLEAQQRAR